MAYQLTCPVPLTLPVPSVQRDSTATRLEKWKDMPVQVGPRKVAPAAKQPEAVPVPVPVQGQGQRG